LAGDFKKKSLFPLGMGKRGGQFLFVSKAGVLLSGKTTRTLNLKL
jgi:hypothetical protein